MAIKYVIFHQNISRGMILNRFFNELCENCFVMINVKS